MTDYLFIAPIDGIFEFIFKGHKIGGSSELHVALRLNGKPVAYAWADYVNAHSFYTPFSIHSILKVKKGDYIDLFNINGIGLFERPEDVGMCTQFTGKLLFANSDSRK